jgi:hypothetical protein
MLLPFESLTKYLFSVMVFIILRRNITFYTILSFVVRSIVMWLKTLYFERGMDLRYGYNKV